LVGSGWAGRGQGSVCGVCGCGRGGGSLLVHKHSKVCTLCDFGHLQFIVFGISHVLLLHLFLVT
jgi:hypothetical protein